MQGIDHRAPISPAPTADDHHEPPLISPARGPPQGDFLDQTPAFDPSEAEPIPGFVFDLSVPDEFDD